MRTTLAQRVLGALREDRIVARLFLIPIDNGKRWTYRLTGIGRPYTSENTFDTEREAEEQGRKQATALGGDGRYVTVRYEDED